MEIEAVFDIIPGHRIDTGRVVRSTHTRQGYSYSSMPAHLDGANT